MAIDSDHNPTMSAVSRIHGPSASVTANGATVAGKSQVSRTVDFDGSSLSPIFKLLSAEIRYQIYHTAFGNRVLHLYLLYCRRLKSDMRWRKGHYPNNPPPSFDEDQSKPPEWRWWSCLCAHQRERFESRTEAYCPGGFFQLGDVKEPNLGVLSWLLTCRRAYNETIEILYRSNTFKLDQKLEALYLPFCLTDWQLSCITSLELRIPERDASLSELDTVPAPGTDALPLAKLRSASRRNQYVLIIRLVEDNFPALKRFHLSLEGSIRGVPVPQANVTTLSISTLGNLDPDELESVVLGPIDDLPAQIERQLMLFQSLYTAVLASAKKRGEVLEQPYGTEPRGRYPTKWRRMRFWRSLEEQEGGRDGYWIYSHV